MNYWNALRRGILEIDGTAEKLPVDLHYYQGAKEGTVKVVTVGYDKASKKVQIIGEPTLNQCLHGEWKMKPILPRKKSVAELMTEVELLKMQLHNANVEIPF